MEFRWSYCLSKRSIVDIRALGSNGFGKKWKPSAVLPAELVSILYPLVRSMRTEGNCC